MSPFEPGANLQMMACSCEETIELIGDDTFYLGSDTVDEDERIEVFEDTGVDPDDFVF